MGEQQGKAHSNRIPLRGYGGPRTATTPFAASHAHRRVPLSMLDKVLRVVFFFPKHDPRRKHSYTYMYIYLYKYMHSIL